MLKKSSPDFRLRRLCSILSAAVCAASFGLSLPVLSQEYPTKPMRLIVPFPPGGGTDILARLIGQKLTGSMGQQVIVDNRPGAGGSLGAEIAAKSSPDGYVLLLVSASYAVNASLHKLAFDPLQDLVPIAQVASVAFVLVAHPSLAAGNVKELIALAQSKPGQINYASTGIGSAPHLAGELFTMMTHTKMTHVPYKGGSPAMADLMGGQVQLLFSTVVQALPQIKAGRLKPIAVAGTKRSPVLPDVLTIDESGIRGYDVSNWFGMLAPRRTPDSIVARLNREIVQGLEGADVKNRLAADGVDAVGSTPAEFGALIRRDSERYAQLVKTLGIRPE
jgi:tripartite-type tricarboxylate transporter receptor subunit TctC